MGDLDDRLRRELGRATRPVSIEGLLDRIGRRHRSRQLRTKIGVSVLSFALAGSAITGVFLARGEPEPTAGGGGGGVIIFSRTLRECSPNVVPTQPPQLFAVTPDGSTEWNLSRALDLPAGARYPLNLRGSYVDEIAFAPGGSTAAWWAPTGRGSLSGITVLDLAGGTQHQVGTGDRITAIGDLAFSPDGRTIAFTAIEIPEEQTSSASEFDIAIWTVPIDGSSPPERLTTPKGLPIPSYVDAMPVWSPDGATIAFVRAHYPSSTGRVRQALVFVDADGSNLREIERQPADANFTVLSGDWSPDGTRFVAEVTFDSFPPTDLYIANIDGRTGYRLTDAHWANDGPGSWSPDGTLIAFQTGRWGRGQGHAEIAITDPSGEHVRRVTNNCWDDESPVWVDDAAYIRSLQPWRGGEPEDEPPPVEGSQAPSPVEQTIEGVPFPVCWASSIPGSFGNGGDTLWTFEGEETPGAGCAQRGTEYVGVGTRSSVSTFISAGLDANYAPAVWPYAAPDIDGDGISEIAVGIFVTKGERTQIALYDFEPSQGSGGSLRPILEAGVTFNAGIGRAISENLDEYSIGLYCGGLPPTLNDPATHGLIQWESYAESNEARSPTEVVATRWELAGATLELVEERRVTISDMTDRGVIPDGSRELCGSRVFAPEDFPGYPS